VSIKEEVKVILLIWVSVEGLKHVRKAVFHRCGYMEDEAVTRIGFLKDTLKDLQISSCGNITDEGLLTLVQMKYMKFYSCCVCNFDILFVYLMTFFV